MEEKQIWDKLLAIADDPFTTLNNWKQLHGKKIIGCLPMYFPEEIIHAAGALPVVIPESEEPISVGHAHIQTYMCGYARSCLDTALKGKYSFLDGWVGPDTCHTIRGLSQLIEHNIKPTFYKAVYFPQVITGPFAKSYLIAELQNFKSALENFMGKEITKESLRQSILLYNKHRALVRKLYDLRRANPGVISAKQMGAAVTASMFMPKEDHNELIEQLLPIMKGKKSDADGRVRLILSGSLCEPPPEGLYDLIDEIGMVIVDDDLYTGARYVGNLDVDPDVDSIEAFADRYLKMDPPCPTRVDERSDWADYLITRVRRSGAQGIISIMPKFCEPHGMYYPYIMKRLEAEGIPELMLETEHGDFASGQLRTRLEAFQEMVGKDVGEL